MDDGTVSVSVWEGGDVCVVFIYDVCLLASSGDVVSVVCEYCLMCVRGICVFVVEGFDQLPESRWICAEVDAV